MRFLNALRADFNKSVLNMGFIVATISTTILCFTSNVYTDLSNEKGYSIFESLMLLDKNLIQSDYRFASIIIFQSALSGYISMFIPIIVAFPFMVSFCSERNSGFMRFAITRTGKYRYYFSKFFTSIITGGLAVSIGVAIFGIIVYILFPNLSMYKPSDEELQLILPNGIMQSVIKMLAAAFVYGAFSTLPAFFISSFCKNPYLITCVPFMLNYIWDTSASKAISHGWEVGDFEIYDRIAPFTPNSITNLLYISEFNDIAVKTLCFNLGYMIIFLIGFIIIMDKRVDKGA